MPSNISTLLIALSVFVGGCATTVLSSGKTTAFENAVSSVNIVFVESDLVGKTRMSGGTTANLANQHRQDLGVEVSLHMPRVFSANGVPARAKNLVPASIPTDGIGYRALFPDTPSAAVLLVNPISAVTTCPGSCFQFRMQAKLVSTSSGMVIWTSTIDLPPKASRFHDFSGIADEFSRAVLAQLKSDGILVFP